MPRTAWVLGLAVMICQPALADGMRAPRYRAQPWFMLPPERHVIEVVQPPWSGNFIINGRRFTGITASLPELGGGRADHAAFRRLARPLHRSNVLQSASAQYLHNLVRVRVDGFSPGFRRAQPVPRSPHEAKRNAGGALGAAAVPDFAVGASIAREDARKRA